MSLVIGLTGGIASGKSTVSNFFQHEGIPVIDTDQIARHLLDKGTDVYEKVIHHFSSDILHVNGDINRAKLGQIIFANPKRREVLNAIIHPKVIELMQEDIKRYKLENHQVIVVDVPLLFESGIDKLCDKTIVVYTTFEKQLERLMSRDKINQEYAQMKIDAQLPLDEKAKRADYIIDNSQSILRTKKDFVTILEELEVK